ncbi:MAG: response regulator, partial [Gammaproteobacteria bacterium]|nr:response regulator [Gammaproteobacteria bacterium]
MDAEKAMNVLVVEGDEGDRNMLVSFLKKSFPDAEIHEYDPIARGRPDAGFDWSRFDVLIMDYRLGPEDNGLDWLRQFKTGGKNFPATILLTAVGNEDLAVKALRYGAHDYLRKQKLNGKKLTESVRDAFNVRAKESKTENSLTINASRFSKSFFYGQFEFAFEEVKKGESRAVLIIRTDGYDALLKSLGVLAMDEIEKYMATNAVEIFNVSAYRSRATRFTDSSIAILVGGYKNIKALEQTIEKFCTFVKDSPPVVNDSPIPITVSIGGVPILAGNANVHGLLEQAEKAASEAAEEDDRNSFVVLSAQEKASNLT